MTKEEIYNQMCSVSRQKRYAEESKEAYKVLKIKVEKTITDLKKPKDNLKKAEMSLHFGGFLIDSKPVDNGKINDITNQISGLVNNAENVLKEINIKINNLTTKITTLTKQYRDLERQYRSTT